METPFRVGPRRFLQTPNATGYLGGLCLIALSLATPAISSAHTMPWSPAKTGPAKNSPTKTTAKKKPAPAHAPIPTSEISAVLLSDIHFDPFHDPGKATQLANAPEGQWNAILSANPSADQPQAFDRLQKACGARGVDTPFALLASSLQAIKMEAEHQDGTSAKFAIVSGDLVVHGLDCRFKNLLPDRNEGDYARFVEKTVRYVVAQTRLSLSGIPVYVALGNNDSGCGDYAMNSNDEFLAATRDAIIDGLPTAQEKRAAMASYSTEGDYSLLMRAPMQNTRLLVLNDLLQSRKYTACGGKPNPSAVETQLAWIERELAQARTHREKVWIVGHIPPGIDSYSTFAKFRNVCQGDAPTMFLSTERLADLFGQYADIIRLGIFGHTHMDEMRLFGRDGAGPARKVAIKLVSSISPVDGNDPSFTVARIDPAGARLLDYTVIAASNRTGIATTWAREYSYDETYHQKEFSPAALEKLLGRFAADPDARSDSSRTYLTNYFVGDKSLLLKGLWPQYACAQTNHTQMGFASCMCPQGILGPGAR